jgi:hypothetical protein
VTYEKPLQGQSKGRHTIKIMRAVPILVQRGRAAHAEQMVAYGRLGQVERIGQLANTRLLTRLRA